MVTNKLPLLLIYFLQLRWDVHWISFLSRKGIYSLCSIETSIKETTVQILHVCEDCILRHYLLNMYIRKSTYCCTFNRNYILYFQYPVKYRLCVLKSLKWAKITRNLLYLKLFEIMRYKMEWTRKIWQHRLYNHPTANTSNCTTYI